jgi:hypothetical protein
MSPASIFRVCGFLEALIGVLILVLLHVSIYSPDFVLHNLFEIKSIGFIAGNSWQQAAVAFGMHGFADLYNGLEQMGTKEALPIPKTVSCWNYTRFVISFCWLLQFMKLMLTEHGNEIQKWPFVPLLMICILFIDAIFVRPIAVCCQRIINDSNPPIVRSERDEWDQFTSTQKLCRGVFYYESVISGTSGAVYFMYPELFTWLYGVSNVADNVAHWSLGQFGVLVMAFGMYQMNSDIDTRSALIAWWLWLDIVWMYVYWQGRCSKLNMFVKLNQLRSVLGMWAQHGPWNPLTLTGNVPVWCHVAFHADSSLALARTVFLVTIYYYGRGKVAKKD